MTTKEIYLNRLQGADTKAKVRKSLLSIITPAIAKMDEVKMLTLAGTCWELENAIISVCKRMGKKYTIHSVERDWAILQTAIANQPENSDNVYVFYTNFDDFLNANINNYNIVFADYMGGFETTAGRKSLETLRRFVKVNKDKPALYFTTFSTMGRGTGKNGMSNIGYSMVLKKYIYNELNFKSKAHVQPVLQLNYKGEKKQKHSMVVLGFAVNFGKANDWKDSHFTSLMKEWNEPYNQFKGINHAFLPFKTISENWLKEIKPRNVYFSSVAKSRALHIWASNYVKKCKEEEKQKADAIASLPTFFAQGLDSKTIAAKLNLPMPMVRGKFAWYRKTVMQGKEWTA
jgi:hypothetical protein